jgi:dodecin
VAAIRALDRTPERPAPAGEESDDGGVHDDLRSPVAGSVVDARPVVPRGPRRPTPRPSAGSEALEAVMSNHVYRLSEIVGSSPTSVDDAIRTAITKATQTVRNIEWFETQQIRGQVVDGDVAYFQVTLKIGFRVDD